MSINEKNISSKKQRKKHSIYQKGKEIITTKKKGKEIKITILYLSKRKNN